MIRVQPGSRVTVQLLDPEHALSLEDISGEVRDNNVLVLTVPNDAVSYDEAFEAVFYDPDSDVGQRMSFVWLNDGEPIARETLVVTNDIADPEYRVGVLAKSDLNAPDGLSLTAQLLDNGEPVQSIPTEAIVFDESWEASWTPEVAGRYTFAWFDGATEIGSEVIEVVAADAVTVIAWDPPSIDDLARRMFARVTGEFGGIPTFTTASRPTAEQARGQITDAVDLIAPQVGFLLDTRFHRAVRVIVVLQAAILTEPGYWPEDLGDYRSAVEEWRKERDTALAALKIAIGEAGSGEDIGPDDDGPGHVVYAFPTVPAYARRDAYGDLPVW